MINYLKSDLYVMLKMRVAYILPIIMLLVMLLSGVIYLRVNLGALGMAATMDQAMALQEDNKDAPSSEIMADSFVLGMNAGEEEVTPMMEDESFGKGIFSGGMLYDTDAATFCILMLAGLTGTMLIGIFSTFLFGNWVRSGLSKNILKGNSNRWIPFLSKALVVLIYTIFMVAFILLMGILIFGIMGQGFVFGFTGEFVKAILCTIGLNYAFAMLVGAITVLTKSTGLGMVFDILCGGGFLSMGFMLIELLINHVILDNGTVSLTEYTLTGTIQAATPNAHALIVMAIYLVVSVICGGLAYQKRDIH